MESKEEVKYAEIACLEVRSWHGISTDAEHFYGKVWYAGKCVKLEHAISETEADALNRKDSCSSWQAGDMTERYETAQQVEMDAIRYFFKQLEPQGAKMMRVGGYAHAHPQKIIAFSAGYGKLALIFTELYEQGEPAGWDWDKDENLLDELCSTWKKFLAK